MEIVKVQIPIYSTDPGMVSHCLVYPKNRRNTVQQEITPEIVSALNGSVKGYFEAEWKGGPECWKIGKRVHEQVW